ncbi:MAG: FAD-dependent thymidylate synthase [Deltaproteobacteria bacterium]|nr:FAD-dependent thymidylate synthase [Deltaproteobacteria bacterium]
MAHSVVEAAEALLDKEIKVLDHGFVRLVDYMGGDQRIVQSARVSYGSGTKSVRRDRGLINYLMRNLHTSPFEQVILTFHCKMPIFVARQWIRHRTARLNEISGRYSVMADEFYLPAPEDIRFQSEDNKQGRSTEDVPEALQAKVLELLKRDQQAVYASYRELIDDNVARELARVNLPLSMYTEWYWQIDLHNLFHFLRLRMDDHAQLEIRRYAEAMAQAAKAVAPIAYDAFEEHILGAVRLGRSEVLAVREMLDGKPMPLKGRAKAELLKKLHGESALGQLGTPEDDLEE